jgi:light-regulated signal transduction histidine kinase (bacteriophytochrome)
VHLDPEGQIREVNDRAREQFPPLVDAVGESLASAFPAAADRLDSTDRILEWDDDGEPRYYLVSEVSATLGQTDIVRTVVFTDVTETEAKRRELERHNAQLEGFAAAIRHNLLNTLQVVQGRLSHANESLEDGDVQAANESLVKASNASREMSETVDDLATLAREGRTIEDRQRVSFSEAVRDAAATVETDGTAVSVRQDGVISADGSRLRELLKNALTFAVYNEASTITLSLRDDGFEITDDGRPPEAADVEQFFQYGEAQPDSDTGMILPNLEMLARTQRWKVTVDSEHRDGFRLVVSGAITDPQSAAAGDGVDVETADSAEP